MQRPVQPSTQQLSGGDQNVESVKSFFDAHSSVCTSLLPQQGCRIEQPEHSQDNSLLPFHLCFSGEHSAVGVGESLLAEETRCAVGGICMERVLRSVAQPQPLLHCIDGLHAVYRQHQHWPALGLTCLNRLRRSQQQKSMDPIDIPTDDGTIAETIDFIALQNQGSGADLEHWLAVSITSCN